MPCWGTLGVVIAHRQPSQSFDARSTSAVEYARVSWDRQCLEAQYDT